VTISPGTRAESVFACLLNAVMGNLAKLLVKDGEGATKIMELEVIGARTLREAELCARQIVCSPLVKTMLAGSDPTLGELPPPQAHHRLSSNLICLRFLLRALGWYRAGWYYLSALR